MEVFSHNLIGCSPTLAGAHNMTNTTLGASTQFNIESICMMKTSASVIRARHYITQMWFEHSQGGTMQVHVYCRYHVENVPLERANNNILFQTCLIIICKI